MTEEGRKKLQKMLTTEENLKQMSENDLDVFNLLTEVAKVSPEIIVQLYGLKIRGKEIKRIYKKECNSQLDTFISYMLTTDENLMEISEGDLFVFTILTEVVRTSPHVIVKLCNRKIRGKRIADIYEKECDSSTYRFIRYLEVDYDFSY